MTKHGWIFFTFLILFFSCKKQKQLDPEIEAIPVQVEIIRFDQLFAQATPDNWQKLREQYPMFFPEFYHDTIWAAKTVDTLQKQLEFETDRVFADFSTYEYEIGLLFKHIKYYFPDFQEPKIYTVISDVDYQTNVVWYENNLILGLDNFLGQDHPFYSGISRFIAKKMVPQQLVPEIADRFALKKVPPPFTNTFMEKMVYYGKILYLKQLLLPMYNEEDIIRYTADELDWAKANESEIWRYFIERELLYSTQQNMDSRFLNDAPFSKFYLELDNESPGRLGQYIGWQIVTSFMKNHTVSIDQLLQTPGEELFKLSKFKPRK